MEWYILIIVLVSLKQKRLWGVRMIEKIECIQSIVISNLFKENAQIITDTRGFL